MKLTHWPRQLGEPLFLAMLAPVLLLATEGCSSNNPPQRVQALKPAVYFDNNSEFPRIEFGNGQVSINDRCPVRRTKLNLRMPPIYVNGRPVGFC